MKKIKLTTALMFSLAVTLSLFTSCQPEEITDGNGIDGSLLDPSFTINAVENVTNRYLLEATTETNMISDWWDIGDGSGVYNGKNKEEIFLPVF